MNPMVMTHACTSPEDFSDLGETLATIRTWPGVEEVRPGVFCFHALPFLYFCRGIRQGQRWACLRHGIHWGSPLALHKEKRSEQDSLFVRRRLLQEARKAYHRMTLAFTRRATA